MGVQLIFLGLLKRYAGGHSVLTVEDAPGKSIIQLLAELSIPPALVGMALVNGCQRTKDYVLRDGDVVKLVPPISGG